MSDSTSLLTQLTTAQAGKEATVNELMNAVSPASLFGRRQSSSGLSWDYFGGRLTVSGTSTAIANGTLTLSASTTNYIECDPSTGVVSKNTTAFTAGRIPLYSVVTDASTVTSYIDRRSYAFSSHGNFERVIVGSPGSEASGINIGGVTYEATFKVSDINGTNFAQTILHRHSTTLEPLVVGARGNTDTTAHADVTAGMGVFSIFAAGWAGSNYKLFGGMTFAADNTGTISDTSAPGKWTLSLSQDGGTTLAAVITARNNKSVEFGATVKTAGYTVATLPAGVVGMRAYVTDATAPTWNAALTGGGAVVCPVFYNGAAWVSA